MTDEDMRAAAQSGSAGHSEVTRRLVDGLELVVVAAGIPALEYRWEIRKLDGSVLERSIETFRSTLLAKSAGVQALAGDR